MKKLSLFAMAAFAAMTMNAQIYVVGSADGITWDLPGVEFAANADGDYVLELANATMFKFSTMNTTEWGDPDNGVEGFNDHAYSTEGLFDETVLEGQTLNLVPSKDNVLLPWLGDYTITIKGDFSAITASTTTPKPEGELEIYVRGAMNDWGNDPAWRLSYDAETDVYSFVCVNETAIPAGAEFKIADPNWGSVNYGSAGPIEPDAEEIWWDLDYNGGNISLTQDFTGYIYFKISGIQEAQAAFVLDENPVDAGVNDIVVDAAEAVYYNLQGLKVQNPELGKIYIKVAGGKAVKVVK